MAGSSPGAAHRTHDPLAPPTSTGRRVRHTPGAAAVTDEVLADRERRVGLVAADTPARIHDDRRVPTMLLLLPSDPLDPRQVDEHFRPEAQAARAAGITTGLVDHDALVRDDAAAAVRTVPDDDDVVYRGWMVRSEQYRRLAEALARRGAVLRTGPDQYAQAHELPGWYDALAAWTPPTVWTAGFDQDAFEAARTRLGPGPAVLRDWTKSMKHYWATACFIPDLADADAAWRVATRFCELRDDDRTGGLVLRRYEPFTGGEVRTWWVDGAMALTGPHPDTPDQSTTAVELTGLARAVDGLGLPFVTVDLARRDDGQWRVVELGDGQVSDRPTTMDPGLLVAALRRT